MIAIIDYGMGNLKNIYKALKYVGADCTVTSDPEIVSGADGIVLPGVGAFKDAISCIEKTNLKDTIKSSMDEGVPFLGICLGMQMLFEQSFENGVFQGLSILKGNVEYITGGVKIPHMGWNSLEIKKSEDPLLYNIQDAVVYFVHSYHCVPDDDIVSSVTKYGTSITSSIWKNNVFGLQFHPEKSGHVGLRILDNFRRLVK